MSTERSIDIFEGKAAGNYSSIDEAAQAVAQDVESKDHHVRIPLEGRVKISVSGSDTRYDPDEKLTLEYCDQKSTVPRSIDGHHGVSTNHKDFCYLIVDVSDGNDPFIDRGVCWVHSGNPGNLTICVTTHRSPISPGQAKIALERSIFKTQQVIREILGGANKLTIVDR